MRRHKCDSVRSRGRREIPRGMLTSIVDQNGRPEHKCPQCERVFRRAGDMKRHRCDSVRSVVEGKK